MESLYVAERMITQKTKGEYKYSLSSPEVQLVRHHWTNTGMFAIPRTRP
jgi:hypothetical protein